MEPDPCYLVPAELVPDAPEPMPTPAPVDLFGDPVEQVLSRSSRAVLADWRNRLLREGIGPADFLSKVMADAYTNGDTERVIRCAELLLPYTLPRLNAVMVGGAGAALGVGGGVLEFRWQAGAGEASSNDARG